MLWTEGFWSVFCPSWWQSSEDPETFHRCRQFTLIATQGCCFSALSMHVSSQLRGHKAMDIFVEVRRSIKITVTRAADINGSSSLQPLHCESNVTLPVLSVFKLFFFFKKPHFGIVVARAKKGPVPVGNRGRCKRRMSSQILWQKIVTIWGLALWFQL